jgi:hypothetical protein
LEESEKPLSKAKRRLNAIACIGLQKLVKMKTEHFFRWAVYHERARELVPASSWTNPDERVIVLVSTQGPQLDRPAPAQDLHTAQEFQRCRAWAEAVAERWFVLTPKYGLVEPGREIAPYHKRLSTALAARFWWAKLVLERFLTFVPPGTGEQVVLCGMQHFRGPLDQVLYEAGYRVAQAPGLVGHKGYMPTPAEVEDLPPVYFRPW